MSECPTARVIGSAYEPGPPATACNTGREIWAEPCGVLSNQVYPVVYAFVRTRSPRPVLDGDTTIAEAATTWRTAPCSASIGPAAMIAAAMTAANVGPIIRARRGL